MLPETYHRGDTIPALRWSLADSAGAVDLSTAVSVTLRLTHPYRGDVHEFVADVVSPATDGVVEYAWQTGDLDIAPGDYHVHTIVEFPLGAMKTFPTPGCDTLTIQGDRNC